MIRLKPTRIALTNNDLSFHLDWILDRSSRLATWDNQDAESSDSHHGEGIFIDSDNFSFSEFHSEPDCDSELEELPDNSLSGSYHEERQQNTSSLSSRAELPWQKQNRQSSSLQYDGVLRQGSPNSPSTLVNKTQFSSNGLMSLHGPLRILSGPVQANHNTRKQSHSLLLLSRPSPIRQREKIHCSSKENHSSYPSPPPPLPLPLPPPPPRVVIFGPSTLVLFPFSKALRSRPRGSQLVRKQSNQFIPSFKSYLLGAHEKDKQVLINLSFGIPPVTRRLNLPPTSFPEPPLVYWKAALQSMEPTETACGDSPSIEPPASTTRVASDHVRRTPKSTFRFSPLERVTTQGSGEQLTRGGITHQEEENSNYKLEDHYDNMLVVQENTTAALAGDAGDAEQGNNQLVVPFASSMLREPYPPAYVHNSLINRAAEMIQGDEGLVHPVIEDSARFQVYIHKLVMEYQQVF